MNRFLQRQTLLRNLLPASTILIFLMISGLFSTPNSSDPRLSTDGLVNKRLKVYQAGTLAIKNASDVHLNLNKATRWANAGIDEREIILLGKEKLAHLEGIDQMIKRALVWEGSTPEEKRLYEVIFDEFENYKKSFTLTIRTAPSNLRVATLFTVADGHFTELHRNLRDLLHLEMRLSPEISYHPHRSVRAASRSLCRNGDSGLRPVRADDRVSRQAYYQAWE